MDINVYIHTQRLTLLPYLLSTHCGPSPTLRALLGSEDRRDYGIYSQRAFSLVKMK